MSRKHEARRAEVEEAESMGAAAGRRSLIASRYPALAQALSERGGEPTIHDAATAAVEHKGSGAAVDPGVAARVGAHLGTDFSGVRVHSDPLAQQATAAMGARAFAYGSDVFLGSGESGGDVGLMAHELTHVAQQGSAGQRVGQRRVQVGNADSPAEREADQVAAQVTGGQGRPASLLVDDGPVQPGQMLKSQFIEQLRAQVTAAADAELGPIYAAIGCPYIEQYFGRYAGQPASAGEALLRRYAPATRTARTAAEMIPAVVTRVRESVRQWRDTGQPPPDVAAMAPAAASGGGAAAWAAQAQALRAPDGGETLASLEAELGPGQPLDGATASRMSDALGADVSSARIHTGPVAARKAADAGALAFAVGPNVVMGAGAPGAGMLEGDALLAHELAHIVQQSGSASRSAPIETGQVPELEHEADDAAASVLEDLYRGKAAPGAQKRERPVLTKSSGLRLQRCGAAAQVAAPPQLTRLPYGASTGTSFGPHRPPPAQWAQSVQAATASADRAALIQQAIGLRVEDVTAASAGDASPQAAHLHEYSSGSPVINYDNGLNSKVSPRDHRSLAPNAGYTLQSGGRNFVVLGPQSLDANDYDRSLLIVNHEFDHVRQAQSGSTLQGNESELDAWTSSFIRDFQRQYILDQAGSAYYVRQIPLYQPLIDYYARSTVSDAQRNASVQRIVQHYQNTLSGHDGHRHAFQYWLYRTLQNSASPNLGDALNTALSLGISASDRAATYRQFSGGNLRTLAYQSPELDMP